MTKPTRNPKGRPAELYEPAVVNVRIEGDDLTVIDMYAQDRHCSRSEAIRRLIAAGLRYIEL